MAEQSQTVLLVLSGPSGVGKTTVAHRLLEANANLLRMVTCTTRLPREGEVDGQDYHFLTEADFLGQIRAGGFLEHAEVYGNRYGTLKSSVQDALAAGRDVLIVNDVQGALTLSAMARQDNALGKALQTLFIVVSDVSELRARLEERAADKADTIEERLAIAEAEMLQQDQFDHVIVSSTREADFERAQNIYQNAKAA
ncbi:MAG: guanylate kinase [Limisphaerales bacterium]